MKYNSEFKKRLKEKIQEFSDKGNTEINNSEICLSSLKALEKEIYNNNILWDIPTNDIITSHRRFVGKSIVFLKRIIRKLLRWLVTNPFLQQREFNASVTRSVNEIYNQLN